MIYIWRARKPTDKTSWKIIAHIGVPDGRLGYAPICGTRMKFNRGIITAFGLGRPVCKSCLRSCEDVRRAA